MAGVTLRALLNVQHSWADQILGLESPVFGRNRTSTAAATNPTTNAGTPAMIGQITSARASRR